MPKPLPPEKLLYVSTRARWRAWLRANYRKETEVWLVFFKKHTGKQRISYNDAVEEALCFGWIDSTVRTVDHDSYAQRFSPRRSRSRYSQANIERLRALVGQKKVAKEVLASLPDLSVEGFTIPPDIRRAIRANEHAWRNFRRFPPGYVRIRVAYIEGARSRPAEFKKRLAYFIRKCERNEIFGFGGIDKRF